MAPYDLKNKLVCLEDLDGMKEEAWLAFRELQSATGCHRARRPRTKRATTVLMEKISLMGRSLDELYDQGRDLRRQHEPLFFDCRG
jgi:hypothetical protein